VELEQIRLALVLADELHFGRTAERLHVSQARVSKQIAALERELGGALFDRGGRRVQLTPLGHRFVEGVGPAYRGLLDEIDRLGRVSASELRIGFTPTTGVAAVGRLVREFERRFPQIGVRLVQITYDDPYGTLLDSAIDVLVMWRTKADPGITTGPAIDRQDRVAVLAIDHPMAGRDSISVHDVDNWSQPAKVSPPSIVETFLPQATEDGRPIARSSRRTTFTTIQEFVALVARNQLAHATVSSFEEYAHRDDLAYVPIRDLPPLDLVLYWWSANETDAIRALARTARDVHH
jgi:DNA-binding transcriptional LysR family regulator